MALHGSAGHAGHAGARTTVCLEHALRRRAWPGMLLLTPGGGTHTHCRLYLTPCAWPEVTCALSESDHACTGSMHAAQPRAAQRLQYNAEIGAAESAGSPQKQGSTLSLVPARHTERTHRACSLSCSTSAGDGGCTFSTTSLPSASFAPATRAPASAYASSWRAREQRISPINDALVEPRAAPASPRFVLTSGVSGRGRRRSPLLRVRLEAGACCGSQVQGLSHRSERWAYAKAGRGAGARLDGDAVEAGLQQRGAAGGRDCHALLVLEGLLRHACAAAPELVAVPASLLLHTCCATRTLQRTSCLGSPTTSSA